MTRYSAVGGGPIHPHREAQQQTLANGKSQQQDDSVAVAVSPVKNIKNKLTLYHNSQQTWVQNDKEQYMARILVAAMADDGCSARPIETSLRNDQWSFDLLRGHT
jgi:hypothetical protein